MTDALMDRIKAHRSAPTVYDPPTFDQMVDRIKQFEESNKELTLQLLAVHGQAADALDRAVVAEAKLAKAVEAVASLIEIGDRMAESITGNYYLPKVATSWRKARAVLAELECKK